MVTDVLPAALLSDAFTRAAGRNSVKVIVKHPGAVI